MVRLLVGLLVGAVLLCAMTSEASAQGRSAYLVRMLRNGSDFRVRVQAAVSLRRVEGNSAVISALREGLRDDHPAVRIAVVGSLSKIGNEADVDYLKPLLRDSDKKVRAATKSAIRLVKVRGGGDGGGKKTRARYYVGIGRPSLNVRGDAWVTAYAEKVLRREVGKVDAVRLAPSGESARVARRIIKSKKVVGYYVDCSVSKLDASFDGVRAEVSLILNTYPGRDMRAMLRGKATVPGDSGRSAQEMAVEGAIRGALRQLPQALERARR